MTRRIPIFEYNEELSTKKPQVYKSLIEGVTEAIKNNKKEDGSRYSKDEIIEIFEKEYQLTPAK